MDADGQHPAKYLKELIPYLLTISKYELFLVKGSRFFFISSNLNIPIMRKIGSFCLEPFIEQHFLIKVLQILPMDLFL